MGEQNEKMDELFLKLKSLGERAKQARASLGSPLVDRVFERVNRISAKLPNDGHAQQSQQPAQEVKISCPKCGLAAAQETHFCSSCGFNFQEERRRRQREEVERETLERNSKMGVVS